MRSDGYSTWSVCLFVCLSVCLLPRFLPPRATNRPKKRHQRVHRYTGFILKKAIFIKELRYKVMAWKPSQQANC